MYADMTKKMIETLQGKSHTIPPVWLMRQAGRYLPEYMATRAEAGDFLSLVYNPKLATEVTLQPIRRYGFDAAILFSDILVVPHALGQTVTFAANHGPQLGDLPVFNSFNAAMFHEVLNPVYETVAGIRAGLTSEGFNETALIGFSGSPWTLASYMLEGHGSKDFQTARLYAMSDKQRFDGLLDLLVEAITAYLLKQIEHGAEIIQLFDSWAGVLPTAQVRDWVIAPTAQIVRNIRAVAPHIPIIGFPKGIGAMLPEYAVKTGVNAVSLDSTTPIEWAVNNIDPSIVLQGNLDPLTLIQGGDTMLRDARNILSTVKGRPHIFNLGHGIDKSTDPANVAALLAAIRA